MKHSTVRVPLFVLAVCLPAALLAAGCVPSGVDQGAKPRTLELPTIVGAGKATRADDKRVDLTYNEITDDACAAEWPGDECVMARPHDASIWKDSNHQGKPKKVRWWIDNDQEGKYYFEIAYASTKEGAAGDWLGTVDPIECDDNHTTSRKPDPDDLDPGDLTWPYRITVYDCTEEGERGDCLCKTDPRIRIH